MRLPYLVLAALLLAVAALSAVAVVTDARGEVRYVALPTAKLPLAPPVPRPEGQIAIIVTGLGLAREPTRNALRLPAAVALAISPYADDAAGWVGRARAAGHEALLMMPVQPVDPLRQDPGPRALTVGQAEPERQATLAWLLGRGSGYVGLAGSAGAFAAAADAWAPAAQELAGRKLAFAELDGDALAPVAGTEGVPYVSAGPALDATPSGTAIDAALGVLEARAARDGQAVGWTETYPVTFARLTAWAATLPDKGLRLVPLGNLLEPAHRIARR